MHFLFANGPIALLKQFGNPPHYVDIGEPGDAQDKHDNEEEDVGVGHFVVLGFRGLPLSLPHHHSHYQKERTLADVAYQAERANRGVFTVLAQVVEVVMVEQNTVEQQADGP